MYRADVVACHQGMRLDRDIAPDSYQPSPRFCLRDGEVAALDDTLTATTRRSVTLSSGARLLNAARDLSTIVAVDEPAVVVVAAAAESRLPLPEAEVACILPGGHVLVTAPLMENPAGDGMDDGFRTGHRVLLVDPDTGRVADEAVLDVPESYLSAVQHPLAPLAVLTAGQGQDGSRVFAVSEANGRLGIDELAENVIAASFNRSGTRLLATSHPSFHPIVRVLNWPEGTQLSSATAADLGLADESFGVCGCYLDDDRVLAMTARGSASTFATLSCGSLP